MSQMNQKIQVARFEELIEREPERALPVARDHGVPGDALDMSSALSPAVCAILGWFFEIQFYLDDGYTVCAANLNANAKLRIK